MRKNFRYKCLSCSRVLYRSLEKNFERCKCGGKVIRETPIRVVRPLTEEQKQFIRDNYQKMIYIDLAKTLQTSERRVTNFIRKAGLRLTQQEFERRKSIGMFRKGQISWNKGLSLPNIRNSGQYTKGQTPKNTLHDGAITFRRRKNRPNNDYYWIRISQNKWQQLHVYLWEKKYGEVSAGYIVRFKDGNHLNCKIENLELITRAQHLRKNSPKVRPDRIIYDRYIAARLGIKGKEKQDQFIKAHPELIEAKRQQLKLNRAINETSRQAI